MDGKWTPTAIDGVLRRASAPIADERGSFTELWRASLTDGLGGERFVQANLSRSRTGVLRGLHCHARQADLWVLLEGRAVAATVDLRGMIAGESDRPTIQALELATGDALYIPPLVAHGFWALEECALLYLVSREYDGSDEFGFAWNDEAAAVPWPAGEPILSQRDRSAGSLADLVEVLRPRLGGQTAEGSGSSPNSTPRSVIQVGEPETWSNSHGRRELNEVQSAAERDRPAAGTRSPG